MRSDRIQNIRIRILTPTWEDDENQFLAPKHLPPPLAMGQEMLEAQPGKARNITKYCPDIKTNISHHSPGIFTNDSKMISPGMLMTHEQV